MIKKIKCNKCKKLLPHTYKFFSFHKPGYLRSTCMICDRKRAKNYYHKNKEIYHGEEKTPWKEKCLGVAVGATRELIWEVFRFD